MLKWMGRYRPVVEQLVLLSHKTARFSYKKIEMGKGIWLSSVDWQVLEYVYEYAEDERMIHICEKIGLAQSTFSRSVKVLYDYGLIARYHTSDNRKNVIIRITDKGRTLYEEFSAHLQSAAWGTFFKTLDGVPDEYLDQFVQALETLNEAVSVDKEKPELIEIEPS